MAELVTQSQYAKMRGCSHQYISKLVNQGRITLIDDKIDPEIADQQIAETADIAHPNNLDGDAVIPLPPNQQAVINDVLPTDPNTGRRSPPTLNNVKDMLESYQARVAKLDFEITTGQWLDKKEVEALGFKHGRMLRDAILVLSSRVLPLIETETDPDKIQAVLGKEIQQILDDHLKRAKNSISELSKTQSTSQPITTDEEE